MATHHRQQPSRLIIPPHLNNFVDTRPMFSPGLPTGTQSGFPPVFPLQPPHSAALQTPLQTSFFPQGHRPGHRAHPSIAHLANAGVHGPLNLPPMTPLGQGQFPPMMMGSQPPFGGGQQFVPKSRRTPSTIGGPPKAPLGGPGRKHSPMPPVAPAVQDKLKKKVVVKLPLESADDGAEGKSLWSRVPLDPALVEVKDVVPPDTSSAEFSPGELESALRPDTVDVFLPGKGCWDELKRRDIDQKLVKLNIEGVSDQVVPELHAPHARAASISSPADPALLLFKLNKLQMQQSQNVPSSSSLSTSPLPPSSTSPNPPMHPRLQQHGHSMSMVHAAHAPVFQPTMFNKPSGFNMFGFPLSVAHDSDNPRVNSASPIGIYAPQGRAPVHLSVPQTPSRAESRPDFVRGFGLDIPEEEEPEEPPRVPDTSVFESVTLVEQEQPIHDESAAGVTSEPQAIDAQTIEEVKPTVHTRHASRISVALSIGSTRQMEAVVKSEDIDVEIQEEENVDTLHQQATAESDAVDDWTGSEDVHSVRGSDDGSIGEWSNPSDEERARQARVQRRMRRRLLEAEVPRKIPNFPRPPEDSYLKTMPNDEIISNPSDEEERPITMRFSGVPGSLLHEYINMSPPSSSFQMGRPLPPLPHSRNDSGHWSYYSNAGTQSRPDSEMYNHSVSRPDSSAHQTSGSVSAKKDALNPLAKPFVFGSRSTSAALPSFGSVFNASTEAVASSTEQTPDPPLHMRRASLGSSRALNAAAREFKPGSFTFLPPAGGPVLSFPEPHPTGQEYARPLPMPPSSNVVIPTAVQGREKRLRTSESIASESDEDDEKENREHLTTYRFPLAHENSIIFRRSAPASPTLQLQRGNVGVSGPLSASAKPFTISGFSSLIPPTVPPVGKESHAYPSSESGSEHQLDESETRAEFKEEGGSPSSDMQFLTSQKQKRAPIPLDFTHPVSTNKVPAGLFKNFVSTEIDDKTRTSIRAVIDSVSDHRSQVSLDDLSMPAISHKASRARLNNSNNVDEDNIPLAELVRNASPTRRFDRPSVSLSRPSGDCESLRSESLSPMQSPQSIVPPDLGRFTQMLQFESRLEDIFDKKFEALRDELVNNNPSAYDVKFISSSTEELVKDAIAMFRTQMRASAERELDDDSRRDAGGELDFELIRNIIEQGHEDTRKQLQQDLLNIANSITANKTQQVSNESVRDLVHLVHDLKNNVLASNVRIVDRIATMETSTPLANPRQEREALVIDLMHALAPVVSSVRAEPLDYEALTVRLSQAVKPHITQLIDLASDKRETADLIASRLMPILQSFAHTSPVVDTENIISEMTAAINRVIAPIDAHIIKEQVADLVVERLDARLSVRESQMNFDNLKSKVEEVVTPIFERIESLAEDVDGLGREQGELYSQTSEVLEGGANTLKQMSELKEQLSGLASMVGDVKTSVSSKEADDEIHQQLERIVATLQSAKSEAVPPAELQEILTVSRQLLSELSPVPNNVDVAMQSMELKQAEVMKRLLCLQESADELHKLTTSSTELQAQVVKARAAHGQIRVEKDNLSERLAIAEAERDRFRAKVEELQANSLSQATEFAVLQTRTTEQENAMHTALERLKIADVNAQTQHERIVELEKANRELSLERQQLKSKADGLKMQLEFSQRDKESVLQTLQLVQNDRDHLASQQNHWEDLRRAAEKIETLSKLVERNENEEVAELKRVRDRAKVLEGEHAALQKRYKDQESKISSLERASSTMRQNFAQSQQRCAEWEKKAKEYEGEVERLSTVVDQTEQSKAQLETDYSFAKIQIEERDSEVRMSKERERTLREDVALLQKKLAGLSSELEELRKTRDSPSEQWNIVPKQNGVDHRPYSRASTDYDSPPTPKLAHTGLPKASGKSEVSPPPTSSTWDSMHAPNRASFVAQATPRGRQLASARRVAAPSPTPSVVSVAPTEGADGWWS